MNRHARRAQERDALRDLRGEGCRCAPTIAPVDEDTAKAAGARFGAHILHQRGCPLGDWVLAANARGVLPALFVTGTDRRCSR